MNSKLMKAALAGTAMAAVMLPSTAAQAAQASANANATVLAAVTLDQRTDLQFGAIVPTGSQTSVVIGTASDAETCNGGAVCVGTTSRASFEVDGTDGQTVTLALPDPSISLTGPGADMALALVLSSTTLPLTAGEDVFYVGGTLTVNANQAEGAYTATFDVEAQYQ